MVDLSLTPAVQRAEAGSRGRGERNQNIMAKGVSLKDGYGSLLING